MPIKLNNHAIKYFIFRKSLIGFPGTRKVARVLRRVMDGLNNEYSTSKYPYPSSNQPPFNVKYFYFSVSVFDVGAFFSIIRGDFFERSRACHSKSNSISLLTKCRR
jgi:hypothetical protein